MLTPSSNTVLEPVTGRMLAQTPQITAHFARFAVTQIALDAAALGQFDPSPILAAAELLSHAKVDVIAWNGTSASWLGLDKDRALVDQIEKRTGIAAATCVLGYFDLFQSMNIRTLGLVTPYTDDVQQRIVQTYAGEGVTVIAERHLGIRDNFTFGLTPESQIEAMIREAAAARPDAVAIVCTNMNGARVAADMEQKLGIPVLDSVAVTLWACLHRLGADMRDFRQWGRLFALGGGSDGG
ncbi:MAG: maleate cis-trans isomerase family protein [Beijerinckiaceae bacterium]